MALLFGAALALGELLGREGLLGAWGGPTPLRSVGAEGLWILSLLSCCGSFPLLLRASSGRRGGDESTGSLRAPGLGRGRPLSAEEREGEEIRADSSPEALSLEERSPRSVSSLSSEEAPSTTREGRGRGDAGSGGDLPSSLVPGGTVARMEGIVKRYEGRDVLSGLSLELKAGQVVALMGPSGCGKTTALRILAGLLLPEEGALEIGGVPARFDGGERDREIRRRMGIMFQGGALFDSLSVGENVAFPLRYALSWEDEREIRLRAEAWLARVGLPGAGRLRPDELSGGMRKRAALARALVHDPDLLLLDEPTTGLDPLTSRKIDRLIKKLVAGTGTAVLCVTHDWVSALGIADRIGLIEGGRLAWEGTPGAFRPETHPVVARFLAGSRPIGDVEEAPESAGFGGDGETTEGLRGGNPREP
jgi:phospholipid/cholesterol/gamma-HCH transport system ATP-binding protein